LVEKLYFEIVVIEICFAWIGMSPALMVLYDSPMVFDVQGQL